MISLWRTDTLKLIKRPTRLPVPWAELTVNLDRSANNRLGQRLRQKPGRTPCLRVSVVGVHLSGIGTFTPLFFANSLASS
jgi:hypothetical protein